MERIATKTKILAWLVVGEKERVDFELCDFSSDQIAQLSELIHRDGKDRVRLTIEAEQKKLQIAPISTDVVLSSLACRPGGQKLKVGGFKSPDERATALKGLIAAATPIVLTIEPVQATLPFAESADQGSGGSGGPVEFGEDSPRVKDKQPEKIMIRCAATRPAYLEAWLTRKGELLGLSWKARLGHYSTKPEDGEQICNTRGQALATLKLKFNAWLDDLMITGSAEARRTAMDRRDRMRRQVNEKLDALIQTERDTGESVYAREPGE
jgi:hypothetical protein